MTTPRDEFIEGIHVLTQYRDGYYNRFRRGSDEWNSEYMGGFFSAVTHWTSGAYEKSYHLPSEDWDATGGFRLVVEAYQDDGLSESCSDEWARGYEDALQMFQEAKGL